jgi:23S rRNA (guanosine2251-2'-O)-methyltransferase
MKERVVVGIHAVNECIKVHSKHISKIWLQDRFERNPTLAKLEALAQRNHVKVEVKNTQELEKFAKTHQGVAAFCSKEAEWRVESNDSSRCQLLLLDGLEDPQNLGAIFRTSWLMNVAGILAPAQRAVGLTPIVHKAACGGVEHVPLMQLPSFGPTIDQLKQQGYWVFGLSHKAKKSLFEVKIPEKIIWALGSEESGLRSTTERLCDELVSIPQMDTEASLNVSVAAGIVCFEFLKEHGAQALKKP